MGKVHVFVPSLFEMTEEPPSQVWGMLPEMQPHLNLAFTNHIAILVLQMEILAVWVAYSGGRVWYPERC